LSCLIIVDQFLKQMMEEEPVAVKKRLEALEEQIKTISTPTPTPKIKAEIETKIKTQTEIKTTPKKDLVDQATLEVCCNPA
jgi:hypothetical protein